MDFTMAYNVLESDRKVGNFVLGLIWDNFSWMSPFRGTQSLLQFEGFLFDSKWAMQTLENF